jgi:hypothetical protein
MKAISLKQPYANLITEGKKTIETRKWATYFRGTLLILASKMPKIEPYGCAVCVVDLVRIEPMTQEHEEAACCPIYPKAQAWFLENVRRIKPIPMKGQLSVFYVPLELSDLTFI